MPITLSGISGVLDNSGAFIAGTAVASTSGTSIDFTGIPSWVKRITVMFNNVSSGGTSNQLIQVGAGSVQTTGYVSSGTFFSANGVATTYSTSGFLLNKFTNAGIVNGSIQISLLGSNIWTVQGGAALNSLAYGCASYGTVTTSGTLDRVRITFANGTDTFTAGSINILYE